MLRDISIIQLIKQKLNYVSTRHNVISNNIAMVDIPNAKTRDLKPFMQNKKTITINRTNDKHLSINHKHDFIMYNPASDVQKLNGNNISLETESMKLNQNNVEHQQAISLYNKVISMFNIASRNAK